MTDMKEILQELKNGNKRFLDNQRIYPNQSIEHVKELAEKGQSPFAVVVCCSDSRLNPIIFFDRGLGDFFIVRTAGNVLDNHAIDSIKYAVNILSVPLILVLGHTKCGAITSAVINYDNQMDCSVHATLTPSVELAKDQHGCIIENATRNNIDSMVNLLNKTEFENSVDIVSGLYDIDTGEVSFYQ